MTNCKPKSIVVRVGQWRDSGAGHGLGGGGGGVMILEQDQ